MSTFEVNEPEEARFFAFDEPAADLGVAGADFFGNVEEGNFAMFIGIFEF